MGDKMFQRKKITNFPGFIYTYEQNSVVVFNMKDVPVISYFDFLFIFIVGSLYKDGLHCSMG
jgi:hypothetical protein